MTASLLARARTALAEGKVVGVPTDTVYGLAVRPSATEELYRLKVRPAEKAIPVLVDSISQALRLAMFPPTARRLAETHWPGPLTLVLVSRPTTAGGGARQTIGIRVPDHPLLLELLNLCGPLAVTSANRSGDVPAGSDREARRVFADEVEIYLPGVCPGGVASTVIETLPQGSPRILRAGPLRL